jgi:DNA (cytosine-5)-methyltransferase 1
MAAWYNEIDPFAAQWLRNLIAAGHIADGDVDERSVEDVHPNDLREYTQCHFFAGIGIWSYALRLAGWPDDRPVWTGSCPCQPFSSAGKGDGVDDERHLWPAWHWLIKACRPARVFGEQVASKDALPWLDIVQADLEGEGYFCWAIDLCAAGVGAPHIRQRLYWTASIDGMADVHGNGRGSRREGCAPLGYREAIEPDCGARRLADSMQSGRPKGRTVTGCRPLDGSRSGGWLGDTCGAGLERYAGHGDGETGRQEPSGSASATGESCESGYPGPTNGCWRDADWLLCRDGVWRPVEPGAFPLAHGASARVGRLRAYGNGIVAPAAAVFIREAMKI